VMDIDPETDTASLALFPWPAAWMMLCSSAGIGRRRFRSGFRLIVRRQKGRNPF